MESARVRKHSSQDDAPYHVQQWGYSEFLGAVSSHSSGDLLLLSHPVNYGLIDHLVLQACESPRSRLASVHCTDLNGVSRDGVVGLRASGHTQLVNVYTSFH